MNDLAERCREILDWHKTGLLHGGEGGKLRDMAKTMPVYDEAAKLRLAEDKTSIEAMQFVIDHAARIAEDTKEE